MHPARNHRSTAATLISHACPTHKRSCQPTHPHSACCGSRPRLPRRLAKQSRDQMLTLPTSKPHPPPRFDPGRNAKNQELHVQLSFTLYQNGTQRNPTQDELEEIFSVFPTCIGVWLMNPLLILQFETLPWPLTIAGMPVYITTHTE